MMDRSKLRDGKPLREFVRLLRWRWRPTIVEIGAHDGETTCGFRALWPRANIIAFEPEPRALAKFKARPETHSVRLHEIAIGDHDGYGRFWRSGGQAPGHEPGEWDASGSLCAPNPECKVNRWLRFEEHSVRVMRLDTVLRDIPAVDLIWADVQGAERMVIEGGRQVLSRTRLFYTECSDDADYIGQPTLAELRDLLPGWEMLEVFRGDVLFRNMAA